MTSSMMDHLDTLTWHVAPEDQGQMIEVSYALDGEMDRLWREEHDRSTRTRTLYCVDQDQIVGQCEPWNRAPAVDGDWTVVAMVPTPADLRRWRVDEGLTQADAARLAGVVWRTWHRWERGERTVPHWLCDRLRQRWGSAP